MKSGMTATVAFLVAEVADALTLPADAVTARRRRASCSWRADPRMPRRSAGAF